MFVNVLLWKEEALELRDSADGFEFTIQDVLRSEHEIRHYDPLCLMCVQSVQSGFHNRAHCSVG